MTLETQINLAILGLGKIAHKFASDVPLVKGVILYAVASRNHEKAKIFAKQHKAMVFYDSYQALVADPKVDLVYIATPNNFHFEHTVMCLEAGKAVLCEKPFGLNKSQVTKMIAKSNETDLFLMEAMWTRFIPATQKVIELVKQGEIGQITAITADFGFAASAGLDSRLYNKALGGGALLDIGIYPIFLSYLLLGRPDKIAATAVLGETGVDAACNIKFDYATAEANLSCSFLKSTPTEAVITGTKGSIKMHSRFHHCNKITLSRHQENPTVLTVDYKGNGYGYELAHAVACLLDKKLESALFSHTHSLHLISLLDEVRKLIGVNYTQDVV